MSCPPAHRFRRVRNAVYTGSVAEEPQPFESTLRFFLVVTRWSFSLGIGLTAGGAIVGSVPAHMAVPVYALCGATSTVLFWRIWMRIERYVGL
jgi:hypothetical protein